MLDILICDTIETPWYSLKSSDSPTIDKKLEVARLVLILGFTETSAWGDSVLSGCSIILIVLALYAESTYVYK